MDATSTIWSDEAGDRAHPSVVLVHGAMDRSAGLLKLSRRLDSDHRVVRYDRRGYGRSRPHPGPFTMHEHVADLTGLLDGDPPSLLVGHSYGGNVALAVAARSPELVRAVVVYEAPLSWFDWWPSTTAGGAALSDADPAEAAERFMRRLVGDHRWERLPRRTRAARRDEGQAMIAELSDLRDHAPWLGADIAVPVLVMHGEHGAEHHRRGSHALVGLIADAEGVEVAGASHFGPNTHPDVVASTIREFVARRAPL